MPDDQIKMPPTYKMFPGLYKSEPSPKLNIAKQADQEKIAAEFLSPQEQVLRRAMQIGNFNYGDLGKLDIPQGMDLKGLLNSLHPAPAVSQPMPTAPISSAPPQSEPTPAAAPIAAQPQAEKMDAIPKPSDPDSELDAELKALKSLSVRGK